MAAGSINAVLNGAYAGGPMAGGGLAREGGAGSARAPSSVGGGGGGGVDGGSAVFGGVDGPLRQLIETKERELHEIHDFRIRYRTSACAVVHRSIPSAGEAWRGVMQRKLDLL